VRKHFFTDWLATAQCCHCLYCYSAEFITDRATIVVVDRDYAANTTSALLALDSIRPIGWDCIYCRITNTGTLVGGGATLGWWYGSDLSTCWIDFGAMVFLAYHSDAGCVGGCAFNWLYKYLPRFPTQAT
jgi:hypothetical protein